VKLPNFIVIGAPKSGTTSLFYYLKQHPDIYLPARKELHYFSYDFIRLNCKGPGDEYVLSALCSNWEEYRSHYVSAKKQHAVGDVSPSYLYYSVHDEIKRKLGAVKIIVMLRNPIEKAYSQYMHMVRDQLETQSFYDALMAEKERKVAGWRDFWLYAESSLYTEKLKGYIDEFGEDSVKVILFDEFSQSADTVMKEIFSFLEVDPDFVCDTSRSFNKTGESRLRVVANFFNRPSTIKAVLKSFLPENLRITLRLKIMHWNTGKKNPVDDDCIAYLKDYFSEDVKSLEALLGKKIDWLR